MCIRDSAYINQMKKKTKKKNESFAAVAGALYGGDIPSPSRKGVKKMKKKGNTSVPYGSGYKKINEQNFFMLVSHGLHHLFGYHHYDKQSRSNMRFLENTLMKLLGLKKVHEN